MPKKRDMTKSKTIAIQMEVRVPKHVTVEDVRRTVRNNLDRTLFLSLEDSERLKLKKLTLRMGKAWMRRTESKKA